MSMQNQNKTQNENQNENQNSSDNQNLEINSNINLEELKQGLEIKPEPQSLAEIQGVYSATALPPVAANHANTFEFNQLLKNHQYLILYFYPKDNTPGCTAQSLDLRNNYEQLNAKNIAVIGVSRDALASHQRFSDKLGLPFSLLSDPDEVLCSQFNVVKDKMMYGKKVRGIQRSTFIFDGNGALIKVWRNVKANAHIEDVLTFCAELLS